MDVPKFKALLKGAITFVPGASGLTQPKSGGTLSARYCYSVWLRHCVTLKALGAKWPLPNVAELGPGDSLGIGLCALLSGAEKYFAFDVKPYQSTAQNIEMLDQLVKLFRQRASIPDSEEYPDIIPRLEAYDFPHHLSASMLEELLAPARVERIRKSLECPNSDLIQYCCPWYDESGPAAGSIDLVYSQAVMEHVEQVKSTYQHLHRWLRTGGLMSHAIDFRSHKRSRDWYGHWSMNETTWRIVRGRRTYLLNRQPIGFHLDCMRALGFEIIKVLPIRDIVAPTTKLSPRFQALTMEDRQTAMAYVLAIK